MARKMVPTAADTTAVLLRGGASTRGGEGKRGRK